MTSNLNVGLGYTDGKSHASWRAEVMPGLRYQPAAGGLGSFVEAAVGTAYLTHTQWKLGHDMGSHFQFEESLGPGYTFDNRELSLNWSHLSNAGIKLPNPGANSFNLRFTHHFR